MSWLRAVCAAVAGLAITLSLAPLSIWILAPIGLAMFAWSLQGQTVKTAFWVGWLFGIGLFGSGASWVYVSINQFGNASVLLAGALTVLWCVSLGLLGGLFGAVLRTINPASPRSDVLLFPALWVLSEWLRTWLLTGFPWLFVGYSQVDGPLQSWAPLGGVLIISFLLALTASYCLHIPRLSRPVAAWAGLLLVAAWSISWWLPATTWSKPSGQTLSVGMVQANIDQNEKWLAAKIPDHIRLQRRMSQPLWGKDLVLWPEAAVPALYQRAQPLLQALQRDAVASGSTFVTGIPYRDDSGHVYNSIASFGKQTQVYHKRKLVPFGEFMPLESLLRGLIDFFDLPMSSFSAGDWHQDYLKIGRFTAAALICYEAVYLDTVSKPQHDAPDLLLTISNDTWFGSSFGPLQHLQMARMRALEWGRSMARGTNNGVSALIAPDGSILQQSEQFKREVIAGELPVHSGLTPYARYGTRPILTLAALLCAVTLGLRLRQLF